MTALGFCVVAALSRKISGLPLFFSERIGKSLRILSTSKGAVGRAEAPGVPDFGSCEVSGSGSSMK
jgi:hypothetical protein